jgi:hypothetical protein
MNREGLLELWKMGLRFLRDEKMGFIIGRKI